MFFCLRKRAHMRPLYFGISRYPRSSLFDIFSSFVPFLEVFVNKICIIVNRSQITVKNYHSHSVKILQTLALDVELYCLFAPRTEIIYVLM